MRGREPTESKRALSLVVSPWTEAVVRTAAIGLALAGAVGSAALFSFGSHVHALWVAMALPLAALMFFFLRRGRVDGAAKVAVFGGVAYIALLASVSGGIRSVAFSGMTIVVVVAATTLPRRVPVGTAAVAAGIGLAFVALLPDRPDPTDLPLVWLAQVMILGLLAAIIVSFSRWMRLTAVRAAEARERFAESEGRLRRALDAAEVAIWDWDVASGAVHWDGVEAILGLEEGSFAGTYEAYQDLLEPEEKRLLAEAIERAMGPDGDDDYEVEQRIVSPATGQLHILHGRGRVLRGPDGEAKGIAGTVVDVTRERELQQRAEATERFELVGQVAGGVAHDVNNLLAAIRGHAELAGDGLHDDSARQELEAIAEATQRGADLTRDLLTLAGRQLTRPVDLDLGAALVEGGHALARLLGERFTLDLIPPERSAWVCIDPAAFERVLLHLVVNARDAMPDGGAIVVRGVTEDDRCGFEVIDGGVGIDAATLPRIFEPFFSTKGLAQGTGVGLPSVKSIVEGAGGAIEIETEVGEGTVFRVLLPAVTPPAAPLGRAPVGSATILVADDDALVRRVIVRVLRGEGHEVLEATSGEEALEIARTREIDLLVTDAIMPGIDGVVLAEALDELQPGVPALMVTGYTDYDGLADVLLKPFRRDELVSAVDRLLQD